MSAPTEKTLNFGLRYASVFGLNINGTPNAVGTTPYEGAQFKGSTAFDLTIPDARKIVGLGEDGITQVVFLPPSDAATGKLHVEAGDPVIAAQLDGTLVSTIGETTVVGVATDKQGFEPRVALMLYQAARGIETGQVYWHTYLLPSAQVVRKANPMNANKAETEYQIAPNRVSKHLWGTAFATGVEGFLQAQILEFWSNYPLRIAAFVADGTVVDFSFPTNSPAVQTTGIVVWDNDTIVATGLTKTIAKVTFATAPAATHRIVTLREVAG